MSIDVTAVTTGTQSRLFRIAGAEWLTSHLDKMKAQLEQSETAMQEYARTSGLSFTSEKENLSESRLKELQDALDKAQADRITNQAKLEGAKSKPADTLPEVLDDTTMREYRQRLTDLQRQYAELSATLTPEHYKVQRVQAQIDELKSAMQRERGNVVHRIGNEYAASLRRETLLSKARDAQAKVVADQSEKAIHYDTLKRDVDSNRHLYEVMLQRVKEASLASAMRDSNPGRSPPAIATSAMTTHGASRCVPSSNDASSATMKTESNAASSSPRTPSIRP